MSCPFLPHLKQGVALLNQSYSEEAFEKMVQFLKLMQEWNRAFNLTAITEPKEMVIRHILDSLSIGPFVVSSPILDVGSGAGLPGIPLSIAFPEKQFTLLDKSVKRIQFLRQVKQILGLNNVALICERVESLIDLRFSCIVSRAFARMDRFIGSSGHLLAEKGRILCMTGVVPQEILDTLPTGWVVSEQKQLVVPGIERPHYLFVIKKQKD